MIRRRILGGMVDFGLRINGSKFLPEGSFNYVYGIQKNITLTETGSYVGNSMPSYEVVNDEIYYKLGVSSKGKENIAILNFKTYVNNQTVKIKARVNSASPGDFLAFCKLDDNDILHLHKKMSGQSQTFQEISYTVTTAGSHFVKVYYYQDHDTNVASTKQYNIDANAGYFKLVPYTYTYANGYDNPKPHGYLNDQSEYTIFVRSYYDWYVYSKPDWVTLEYRNNSTNGQSTIANVGSSNRVHRGKSELSIYVKANHGLARSGDIVLKEIKRRSSSKPEQTVTIHISQDANPKPNDIIVTLDKAEVPTAQTLTTSGNKALSVNVKLIGYTDYNVSCSDNKFNFIKGDLTQLNNLDTDYKDMSVKSGTLTILKKDGSEISSAIRANIIGTNGYNTTDIQKYIDIKSDTISCYCDCFNFNKCRCDVEQKIIKTEYNSCNYSAPSCPKHCSANTTYLSKGYPCNGHRACPCNCNDNDPCNGKSPCNCDTYYACPSQCSDTCNCYNTCDHCYGHCTSQCGPNNTCGCHGEECLCNGPHCYGECSGKNATGTNNGLDILQLSFNWIMSGVSSAIYEPIELTFKKSGTPVMKVKTDTGGGHVNFSTRDEVIDTFVIHGGIKGTNLIKVDIYGSYIVADDSTKVYSHWYWSGEKYVDGSTISLDMGHENLKSSAALTNIAKDWPHYKCTIEYCACDDYSCPAHCPTHDTRYNWTDCDPENGCYSHKDKSCDGDNTHTRDTCQCDCNTHTYGFYGTVCNCDTKRHHPCSPYCTSECKCYDKLYYPYCDCETYCECYNYRVPSDDCNSKTYSSCSCNNHVTCEKNPLL